MANHLDIIGLGTRGDGIAEDGSFVPFSLPGETVERNGQGGINILSPSPFRIEPLCRHFGTCGGCALQHLERNEYLNWKRQQVVEAFRNEGLSPTIAACLPVAVHSRRRATLSGVLTANGIAMGFQARGSHDVVDLKECPVMIPAITDKLAVLRQLAVIAGSGAGTVRITVLACNNGLDVVLENSAPIATDKRKALIDWALGSGIARLSVDDETILQITRPLLSVGGVSLAPPAGVFAQAVTSAEDQMTGLVARHLEKCRRVVDLFSGYGTFALRLAQQARIHAVEHEESALLALAEAAGKTGGIREITTEQRDLFRRPLQPGELNPFDGAIFDPPRAGAEDQAKQLAASNISKIAAVSCNPVTLARDVNILVSGGYKLRKVVPIDQFLFSPHVEAIALLERKKTRAPGKIFG